MYLEQPVVNEVRGDDISVEELIVRFIATTNPREIEVLADLLGAAGDRRAVRPLLMRLGDSKVQEDPDVEDAVCRALIALDVMRGHGNLSFCLRSRDELCASDAASIGELLGVIPWRYFGTKRL